MSVNRYKNLMRSLADRSVSERANTDKEGTQMGVASVFALGIVPDDEELDVDIGL